MRNLSDICDICGELMRDSGYKVFGCELCPVWLKTKCVFPNASETKLQILFDVKCQESQHKQKAKLSNLVSKDHWIHEN